MWHEQDEDPIGVAVELVVEPKGAPSAVQRGDVAGEHRRVAPVPPVATGSSAPESVEATLTRKMLMAGDSSSYGGTARRAVTKLSHAVSNAACCALVNPSASNTTLKARLRGAEPKIWVWLSTVPSEVVMTPPPDLPSSGKRSISSPAAGASARTAASPGAGATAGTRTTLMWSAASGAGTTTVNAPRACGRSTRTIGWPGSSGNTSALATISVGTRTRLSVSSRAPRTST